MNTNSPENMNSDINPADKLQEIQTFLAGQEFQVYTREDKEYEYIYSKERWESSSLLDFDLLP